MANTFQGLKGEYQRLLDTMKLTRADAAMAAARKVFKNGNRYIAAGLATGVPWPLVGVLDLRESDCNPGAALGQGDPWNRVSTNVPRGKGPFSSWEDAAKYYIHYDGLDDPPGKWDMALTCYMGEKWNGWGYRNKGIFSPYLWAGSTHYSRGKYVADGQYSSSAVDQQLGIIPVLYQMVVIDPETYIGAGGPSPPSFDPPPLEPGAAPYSETGTMWIQSRLNLIMVANSHDPATLSLLRVDGDYGRLTAACVRDFQTWQGLPVDGDAGDVTTAAIDAELAKINK
jgi:lysozyme family protein